MCIFTVAAAAGTVTSSDTDSAPPVRALLVPVVETTLSSRMSGRITAIDIREGEQFKKDQPLVKFDCEIQRSHLRKAQATLIAAKKTHESNLQLQSYKSIGGLEVELSAADVQTASADVAIIRAELKRCQIDAPFKGRVVEILAHPHESVSEHQPLLAILNDTELELQLYIPSWWLSWLKTGDDFTIRIDETGKSYPAKVIRLGARVDPASQSLAITARIDGNYTELLAGMSGVARFDVPDRP
ncbi:MAG: efflux RND transporter periplasmic adaptor subunit [Pseudomonadota bacterium]